jgi:maltose O-acetyltransferase
MRTERGKMLRGELYLATDPELVAARVRARRLTRRFNAAEPGDAELARAILAELLGALGRDAWIEAPFHCDYGSQIALGDGAFVNMNCVFLDCAAITIGAQAQLGPGVQLLAATHPLDPAARAAGPELARPIAIGARAWLGGGAIVLPGVTIGADTVVGAGSVVTRDLPAGVLAVGNPFRVVRRLDGGARPETTSSHGDATP